MDKPVLPLPPGMVPSSSREDMTVLKDLDENTNEEKKSGVLKEVSPGGRNNDIEEIGIPVLSGRTPQAWEAPDEDIGKDVVLDTSTFQANKGKGIVSPFISTATAQATEQNIPPRKLANDQITPKRVMSPLKRFNKVAPSLGKPSPSTKRALQMASEVDTPLRSNSASLLDQRTDSRHLASTTDKRERPDSAPSESEDGQGKQVPIEDRVIVIQLNDGDEDTEANTVPIYSTVIKKRTKAKEPKKHIYSEPSTTPTLKPNAEEPKIHIYSEPCVTSTTPSLDTCMPKSVTETSLIISNKGNPSPEPLHTLELIENDYSLTPDPLYSTVEEVDTSGPSEVEMVMYDPALVKQLKKHNDKGTVQLVSIKGIQSCLPSSQTLMSFPHGSSGNMHALHYAAASGNKKALTEIISTLPISQDTVEMVLGTEKLVKREGIDIVDSEGRTPFMHAVHHEQLQAVKMLSDAGANVNITAADGSTSLHQAAYSGSVEMVALLLSLGADGLIPDSEGRTPLHWCTNNPNSECMKILLDKVPGLDINIRDGALMTPLMWAAFHSRSKHVRVLIEKGADPSLRDMDGMSAVHWSVQKHDTQALQLLINSESVQYIDKKGKSVMHQAAEQGSAKTVSLIKAVKPTSVNDMDMNGRTPLHWATVCENPEVTRALLHHGADPSIQDFSNKTALEYATEKGLHYCALILTKAEVLEYKDCYHSVLMCGSTPATLGIRTLNKQEGHKFKPEEIKAALNEEQILQIQTVCCGSWIYKFTNNGKGPLHPRYFWVNPSNTKICWAKTKDAVNKYIKSDTLAGTRSSASPAIYGRRDFDPVDKHKYAFTIFTSNRVLDVVAVSTEDYKLWLNGLQLLLHLGSVNVTKLMSAIQNASSDPKPIP